MVRIFNDDVTVILLLGYFLYAGRGQFPNLKKNMVYETLMP
jgi:hypothetical protein